MEVKLVVLMQGLPLALFFCFEEAFAQIGTAVEECRKEDQVGVRKEKEN